MAIMLSGLKRKLGRPAPSRRSNRRSARCKTDGRGRDRRQESVARAASRVLEHLGLTATLRAHCADIERHHQVTVTFNPGDGLDSLDPDVALCLFRVVQKR